MQALARRASACCPTTNTAAATSRRRSEAAPHRLAKASFAIGGQEHFYLEGQISVAAPGEGREMSCVYASTQDPTEVQHIVARILGESPTPS